MRNKVIISFFAICVISYWTWEGYSFFVSQKKSVEKNTDIQAHATVVVEKVERKNFQERFLGYGITSALQKTNVSAGVGGIVLWISPRLRKGSHVEKGEALVQLDDRDLKESVISAEADLKSSKALLNAIKIDLVSIKNRVPLVEKSLSASQRELFRLKNTGSKSAADRHTLQISEIEQSLLSLKSAYRSKSAEMQRMLAQIQIKESSLVQAKNNLVRATILAPYKGRIVENFVQIGTRVTIGSKLFHLIDPTQIEATISLGASHFNEINYGAEVELRYHQEGEVLWKGPIMRISPVVDTHSRTFKVFCEVRSVKKSPIPPGAFVFAYINGHLYKDVIVVPRNAFNNTSLYVAKPLEKNEKQFSTDENFMEASIEERFPKVIRYFRDFVLVEKGLSLHEFLVVSNLEEIAAQSRVIAVTREYLERKGN